MENVWITRSYNPEAANAEKEKLEAFGFEIKETEFALTVPVFDAVMPYGWKRKQVGLLVDDFYNPEGVLAFRAITEYNRADNRIVFYL